MNTSEAIKFANRLVSCKILKKTKLWNGSQLEIDFMYGGVRLATIDKAIKQYKAMEKEMELTENEKEFLKALQETWDNEMIRYYDRII